MGSNLREPLWGGPYHPSWPPAPGSWVMWIMPTFVKVGKVTWSAEHTMSLIVMFQGHPDVTNIPDAYQYWDPHPPTPAPEYTMHLTQEPAILVEGATGDTMTVRQAAALLGKPTKQIRQMLRAGTLQGRQVSGSWVEVEHASVRRLQAGGSLATD